MKTKFYNTLNRQNNKKQRKYFIFKSTKSLIYLYDKNENLVLNFLLVCDCL